MIGFSLQEYQVQRQYREQRRKQYLTLFEDLKKKMGVPHQTAQQTFQSQGLPQSIGAYQSQWVQSAQVSQQPPQHSHNISPYASAYNQLQSGSPVPQGSAHVPHHVPQGSVLQAHVPEVPQPQVDSTVLARLQEENVALKREMAQVEQAEKQKLETYKSKITDAKNLYMQKITAINTQSQKAKEGSLAQLRKLEEQIISGESKNKQILQFNQQLQEETQRGSEIMSKYYKEIEKEYSNKLDEFNKIYESSTEKIAELQSSQNDSEFIEATLNNNQIIESIKANAESNGPEIEQMLADYKELEKGKQEIVEQLTENNNMKEKEIEKMKVLEEKLKVILEKLGEEKRVYSEENERMGAELMEVKELLTKTLGS